MPRKAISPGALVDLQRRLGALPPRSSQIRGLIQEASTVYGISEPTLYRLLRKRRQPRLIGRSDRGVPLQRSGTVAVASHLSRRRALISPRAVATGTHGRPSSPVVGGGYPTRRSLLIW